MGDYSRGDRIAAMLRRELATLIWSRVNDPRLGPVTVTDVEVSRDISHAVVYLNTSEDETMAASLKVLAGASGFLRRELGKIMKTRIVPELHFRNDDSLQKGDRIDALLKQADIQPELPDAPDPDSDEA